MARESSRQPLVREHRPPCQRVWRHVCDVALFDGSGHMVAGNQELAPQPQRELEVELSSVHLGRPQRTRVLELTLHSDVGNFWELFCFPAIL